MIHFLAVFFFSFDITFFSQKIYSKARIKKSLGLFRIAQRKTNDYIMPSNWPGIFKWIFMAGNQFDIRRHLHFLTFTLS